MKKTALMVMIVLVLTSFCFFRVKTVHATDWLSGWDYRKSHVINNSTGAGTNYQLNITVLYDGSPSGNWEVSCEGHCKTDFGDIRFTDNDKTTELDYWMQNLNNGDNATFWLEVTDDLSSSDVTIYLYYGKADATTTSNFDNTFIFGDPFDSDVLDTDRWTSVDGNPTYTINGTGHYLEVTNMDVGWYNGKGFHSRTDIEFPATYIVEDAYSSDGVKLKHKTDANGEIQSILLIVDDTVWANPNFGVAWASIFDHWSDDAYYGEQAGVGENADWGSGEIFGVTGTWYNILIKIWKLAGNIRVKTDSTVRVNEANSQTPDRVHLGLSRLGLGYNFGNGRFYALKIRKYVDPEPIHGSWGSEETSAPTQPSDAPVIGPFGPSLHRIVVNVKLKDDWVKGCNVTVKGGPDNKTEWGLTNLFGRAEFRVKTGSYDIGINYEVYTRTIPLHVSQNVVLGIELTEDDYVVESFMEWTPETMLILVPAILLIVYALKRVSDSPNRKWKYSYLK